MFGNVQCAFRGDLDAVFHEKVCIRFNESISHGMRAVHTAEQGRIAFLKKSTAVNVNLCFYELFAGVQGSCCVLGECWISFRREEVPATYHHNINILFDDAKIRMVDVSAIQHRGSRGGFVLQSEKLLAKIETEDLIYVETEKDILKWHCTNALYEERSTLLKREPEFETKPSMIKVGRSYYINVLHVVSIIDTEMTFSSGEKIFIPRRQKKDVLAKVRSLRADL